MKQNLKGFRDFLPNEKRKKDYIITKLVEIFERFGFEPLETPTLEYANLLLGKYGKEADKLIYTFKDKGERLVALKYDQTVPTARILSQYENQLPKYFRRYQIQSVFRAEKPQKGRYREFTQCDIDIFGSKSLLTDSEILATTYFGFLNLGIKDIKILINDRNILFSTLQKFTNQKVNIFSLIQSLDKLEKIGQKQVIDELTKKGLPKEICLKAINELKNQKIIENLQKIIQYAANLGVKKEIFCFNPFLARGLDYYTSTIFEVVSKNFSGGSLAGGGRYDNLINQITGKDIPAVGLAFGLDRIMLLMENQNLFPNIFEKNFLVTIFSEKTINASLQLAKNLRQLGYKTQIFPKVDKLDKQIKYADKNNFAYVLIIGEDELKNEKIKIKKMKEKIQEEIDIKNLQNYLKKL